jgi:hypothetical protein
MYPNAGRQFTSPEELSTQPGVQLPGSRSPNAFIPRPRPIIMEPPEVHQWGPIIRARYKTPKPYTSWCVLLSVPFTGGRAWFDLRFKRFDRAS